MIYLLILIVMNVILCYMHEQNRVFPIFFMLSEIYYGIYIMNPTIEVIVGLLMVFMTLYNSFLIINQRKRLQ